MVASPVRNRKGSAGKETDVATNVLREVLTDDSPLNAAELLERVDGDRDLLQELSELFRDDWRRQIDALRGAAAAGNAKGILAAGHALKGMLANLTAAKAAAMAGTVEMAGRRGDCGVAGAKVAELEREIMRVESALEGMCARVKQ
jgi:HPt (histidine-containing phosphotransfer) domain-containing protein